MSCRRRGARPPSVGHHAGVIGPTAQPQLEAVLAAVADVLGQSVRAVYLHGSAIFEANGVAIQFSDDDDVPTLSAQHMAKCRGAGWHELSLRARKRLRYNTKHWLNTLAVDRMTPARLAERDPEGEIRSWLKAIAELGGR